jgi:hypothetical protein
MRVLSLAIALFALAICGVASAEEPATMRARTHFENGVRLFDAAPPDFNGALAEFREAYSAKPSPGIKRNIALCLRALHRYGEAIDALTEMLKARGPTLTPHVRNAAEKAISEMNALIATVRVTVVVQMGHAATAATEPVVQLFVDDEREPRTNLDAPLRLGPGDHVLRARAPGFPDAVARVSLTAGERDTPVRLELVAVTTIEYGRLLVRTPIASCAIIVDNVVVGYGEWAASVRAGKHHVAVMTYKSIYFDDDIDVPANGLRDVAIDYRSVHPAGKITFLKPTVRSNYIVAGFTYAGEQLTYAGGLDGSDSDHSFTGGTLTLKYGRHLSENLSLELLGEIGSLAPQTAASPVTSSSPPTPSSQVRNLRVTSWVFAPEFRYQSSGHFRFVTGIALGLQGQIVNASVADNSYTFDNQNQTYNLARTSQRNFTANGVSIMGLYDLGLQFDIGSRFFAEMSGFVDTHGIGAPSNDGKSLFESSPAFRFGARFLIGYGF